MAFCWLLKGSQLFHQGLWDIVISAGHHSSPVVTSCIDHLLRLTGKPCFTHLRTPCGSFPWAGTTTIIVGIRNYSEIGRLGWLKRMLTSQDGNLGTALWADLCSLNFIKFVQCNDHQSLKRPSKEVPLNCDHECSIRRRLTPRNAKTLRQEMV